MPQGLSTAGATDIVVPELGQLTQRSKLRFATTKAENLLSPTFRSLRLSDNHPSPPILLKGTERFHF